MTRERKLEQGQTARQRRPSRCTARALVLATVLVVAVGSCCAAGGSERAGAGPAAPAGIVFFVIDSLRADHVGGFGYRRPTTPSLDELMTQGTAFPAAFAQAPFTLPSVSSLFTSLYPPSHGVLDEGQALGTETPTLAQILRIHGYRTGFAGGGDHVNERFGLTRGFDWTLAEGSLRLVVPRALAWLDAVAPSPFFLVIHGYDVHAPYGAPLGLSEVHDPGYRGVVHAPGFLTARIVEGIVRLSYDPGAVERLATAQFLENGLEARELDLAPPHLGEATPAGVATGPSATLSRPGLREAPRPGARLPVRVPLPLASLSEADLRHLIAHYDGAVTYADTWLGVFADALSSRGLLDRTLLVILADHGEELGEHGRFGHGRSLAEGSLHVPLIFRGPGIAGDRKVPRTVELVDLAPTVLELASIPACRSHQGQSLAAVLGPAGQEADAADRAAFSFLAGSVSIRTARHRAVFGWPDLRGQKAALYDLDADPAEQADLAGRAAAVVSRLEDRIRDFTEMHVTRYETGRSSLDESHRRRLREMGYW